MTIEIGQNISIPPANLPTITAEMERIVDVAGNNAAAAMLKAKTLEQENAELRRQVAELRQALRTLAYHVQTAMPVLTALVEQRDNLAMAWSKVDNVMRETQ